MLGPGEHLVAPGILRNPVPVVALYDREAGHRATLRNLLQRQGYDSLEAVRQEGRSTGREEGREEGMAQAILALLRGRGLEVPDPVAARVSACRQADRLTTWLLAAARVEQAGAIFDDHG